MNAKGQADLGVGGLIALLILISIGAYVLYEVTGSLDFDDERDSTDTVLLDQAFNFGTTYWDNLAAGDNNTLYADNWGAGTDNAVWDNTGGDNDVGAGAYYTVWFQSLVVPAYDGISAASITGEFLLSDNTVAENLSIYVYLENPAGDNTEILLLENTSTLFVADNDTWTSIDNDVLAYVTGVGTYIVYFQDNIDRLQQDDGDNYIGFVWDNCNLSVTTYSQGYAENAVAEVEEKGETTLSLVTILAIVLVAALIIGVVMRAIGGAIGGPGVGTVAPAF